MNKATFNYVPDEPEKAEEPAVSHETPEAKPEPSAPEPAKEAGEPAQESAGELIALDKINPIQVFSTENGLDPLIKRIKEEVEKEVLDPSDEKGRTRIRSLARKIGGAKMRLKEMGQGLTEDWRQKTKAVTTETSRMEKEIDAIRDAVLKPLEEYEARAAERKAKFENRINEILTAADFFEPLTADELKARIDKITVLYKHEWEEFEVRATQAWEQVKPKLYKLLEERTKYEADQAELERLRQEKEESEREEKIKLDAQEAERQKQKQEADQAEAERQKREADKKHRKGIDDAAEKAIVTLLEALNDDYESSAKAIVEAIAAGKVPHVKIEY